MAILARLCVLLAASTWVSSDAATTRLRHPRMQVALMSSTMDSTQTTARYVDLTNGLWASLVLRTSTNPVDKELAKVGYDSNTDFKKADTEIEKEWVSHCAELFDTRKFAVPDDVVNDMCKKAGGTPAHCKSMDADLWAAHKAGDLEPWCTATFAWFAKQTMPKCMAKCPAAYCKERCSVHDKYLDLKDRVKAYQIKYDMFERRYNRTIAETGLDNMSAALGIYNSTKCVPVADNITLLEEKLNKSQAELADAANKTDTQKENQRAAKEALRAAQAARKNSSELVAVKEAVQNASAAVLDAKKESYSLNGSVSETLQHLSDARFKAETCNSTVNDMDNTLKQIEAALDEAKDEAGKAEAEMKDLKSNISALEKIVESAKANVSARVEEDGSRDDLNAKDNGATANLTELQSKFAKANDNLGLLRRRITPGQEEMEKRLKLATEYEEQLDKQRADVAEEKKSVGEYRNTTVADAEKDLELEQNKSAALAEDISKLTRSIVDSREAVTAAKAAAENAKAANELDTSEAANATAKKAEADYKKLLEESASETATDKALESLKAEKVTFQQTVDEKKSALNKARGELADKELELKHMSRKATSIETDLNTTLDAADKANSTIVTLNETYDKFSEVAKKIEVEINATISQLANITASKDALTLAEAIHKSAISNLTDLENFEALRAQNFSLSNASVEKNTIEVTQRRKELDKVNGTCKNVTKNVSDLESLKTDLLANYSQALIGISDAELAEKTAREKEETLDVQLIKNVSEAQAEWGKQANLTSDLLKATADSNKQLKDVQGELVAARTIYADRVEVLAEMGKAYKAKKVSVLKELNSTKAEMDTIMDKINVTEEAAKVIAGTLDPLVVS